MTTPILALMVALMAPVAPQDTLLSVDRGTRLDVELDPGRVEVQAWDRDAVRIRTRAGPQPVVSRSGSVVRVLPPNGPTARQEDMDLDVRVPAWMDVRIHGQRVAAEVRGTQGEVTVETMSGDVVVEGGAGRVLIRTIQGAVRVRDTRGRVDVVAVNQSVRLDNVTGDVSVETTNGSITLGGIRAANARASTVNGGITFAGTIRDDGRYAFSTHNGNITVMVPETANATVSAGTYNGGFESEFPVRLTGTGRDRHYHFTLGSGSARVELESFNGNIRLRRPR
jgi:hypothetical protein